jgi:hypothetical protein
MAGLGRRLESLEARRKRREGQPGREALARLSDEELSALERAALSLSPGEPLPPNPFIEAMKAREAGVIEQQRRNAEESRRRSLQLPGNDE